MFGIFPVCYAFGLSFTDAVDGGFYGLTNYAAAAGDFRLPQSLINIATYVAIWVAVTVVGVTAISMMLDTLSKRTAAVLRTVFFLPGAITSSAIVVLWLFLLDPVVSPFQLVYHLVGWQNRANVMTGMTYAGVFATMGYFASSGGWIVVFGGAIAGLPQEVMEAARIDGANRWQLALRIKIPMLWRSIALMGILCVAGGLQIFVEPQLLTLLGSSYAQPDWSVNQPGLPVCLQPGRFRHLGRAQYRVARGFHQHRAGHRLRHPLLPYHLKSRGWQR